MSETETSINIIIGGDYAGNSTWSRLRNGSDNCFKVYYIYENEVIIYDDEEYVLLAGKVYLINGYRMKGFKSNRNFSVGWLHFISEQMILNKALQELPLVNEFSAGLPSEFGVLLRKTEILISGNRRLNYCLLKLTGLLLYGIAGLLEQNRICVQDETPRHRLFLPVLKYIDSHLYDNLSLSMLAAQCHLSPSHFIRQFTGEYKITPMNYVLQIKMRFARDLLLNSHFTVKEIGARLNFYDPAYFSRVFKKYYGVSPDRLRNYPLETML